jgi:hypothetical protein
LRLRATTPGWPWLDSGTRTATLTIGAELSATASRPAGPPAAQPASSETQASATASPHPAAAPRRNLLTLDTLSPPARTASTPANRGNKAGQGQTGTAAVRVRLSLRTRPGLVWFCEFCEDEATPWKSLQPQRNRRWPAVSSRSWRRFSRSRWPPGST